MRLPCYENCVSGGSAKGGCWTQRGSGKDQMRRAVSRGSGGGASSSVARSGERRERASRKAGVKDTAICESCGASVDATTVGGCWWCELQHAGIVCCGGQWLQIGCAVWYGCRQNAAAGSSRASKQRSATTLCSGFFIRVELDGLVIANDSACRRLFCLLRFYSE
jgi:hypothetical protein